MQSNNPTINNIFKDPSIPVSDAVEKFESGKREIEHRINDVLKRFNMEGKTIADVGSGTGKFVIDEVNAVGPNGTVYCCEPMEKLRNMIYDRYNNKLNEQQRKQTHIIHSTETDVKLPHNSCDIIVCFDTYHHFEYLEQTLTSIRNGLKDNGLFVVCDFHKDFNEWSQGHVRATKEEAINEIVTLGKFTLKQDITDLLKDNWLAVFTKA